MSASGSNRALRALVAELAELGDRDLKAILVDLDAGERDCLLELMAEYRDGGGNPEGAQGPDLALSDWLTGRLREKVSSGMTTFAAEALRQSATSMGWRAGAPAALTKRGLPAWLGRRP
ncbi:hypothetical protein [Brevundimonas sp.]|uniref:hypothetical protein n=1 Tax=Brevundimonas sp. TaxID=1871086 RepID=UPI002D702938|nr:hypothetical protein [Brevundimonas sp.]HYC68871.1 hypothetical protein [Brevundimonas sp.]